MSGTFVTFALGCAAGGAATYFLLVNHFAGKIAVAVKAELHKTWSGAMNEAKKVESLPKRAVQAVGAGIESAGKKIENI